MYLLQNLGFIAHPRTGSRSVRDALRSLGAIDCSGHHHADPGAIACLKQLDDGIVACVTRNIFDIFPSWWAHERKLDVRTPNFKPFVQHRLTLRGDHQWFGKRLYHYGLEYSDFVIRYETMQEDFDALMDKAGHPRVALPHVGKTDRRPYREYYDPELRAAVEHRYAEDLRRTGSSY